MDVDCRITTDGDYSVEGTENYMAAGWIVEGMTEEFGGDCVAYRNSVKARAGSTRNDDLGSICKFIVLRVRYDMLIMMCLCTKICISSFSLFHLMNNRGRRCHWSNLQSSKLHQSTRRYCHSLPARSWYVPYLEWNIGILSAHNIQTYLLTLIAYNICIT